MKRSVSVILAVVILLMSALAGCGNSPAATTAPPETQTPEETTASPSAAP